MSATLELVALGVPIDIDCVGEHASQTRAALADRWSLCSRPPGTPAINTIPVALSTPSDDPSTLSGVDLSQLMVSVTHRVTYAAIEANIGSLLMFHAAGIASLRTGATLICVAPGGTGKTTLCRTLGPGRGYVSDETVAVASDGTVRPYPKPLSVRRDGHTKDGQTKDGHTKDGHTKDELDPVGLGLQPAPTSAYAAGLLVLDRHDDGPDVPLLEDLGVFEAATAVAPETSSLSQLPRPLHLLAELLDSLTIVARVTYREAESLEPLFSQVLGPPRGGLG